MNVKELSKTINEVVTNTISVTIKNVEQIMNKTQNNGVNANVKNKNVTTRTSQSVGLSNRHINMSTQGIHITDESKYSEKKLNTVVNEIIKYSAEKLKSLGYEIEHEKKITLFECQQIFKKNVPFATEPNEENKKVYMLPDGGIVYAVKNNIKIPILITEDKLQGTNDKLYSDNKKRQSTGNAIERAAKNIRGSEMIFSGMPIFPYAIFASGCDFHSCETIAKRLEMANMGKPNYKIELDPNKNHNYDEKLQDIIQNININKISNYSIASIFIKTHKWDEMSHGSSRWNENEMFQICRKIVDQSIQYITTLHN